MDSSNTADAPSSPHSTTSASHEAGLSARSSRGEHADSPMRKKPRLDSSQSQVVAMSDSTIADDSTSSSNTLSDLSGSSPNPAPIPRSQSPAATPSKVTINLRKSKVNTSPTNSAPQPETTYDARPPLNGGRLAHAGRFAHEESHPTQFMDATRDSPIISRHSPPVIDIALDGDDNVDENGDPHAEQTSSGLIRALELIETFPGAQDFGSGEAVRAIVAIFDDEPPNIPVTLLDSVGNWLQYWLETTQDLQHEWAMIYAEHRSFWAQVSVLFLKLLTKKYNIIGLKTLKCSKEVPIIQLFRAYIQLCDHFITVDAFEMQQRAQDDASPPELQSSRFQKTLSFILKDPGKSQFWLSLATKYGIHPTSVVPHLAKQLLEDPNDVTKPLIHFASSVSLGLSVSPQMATVLLTSVEILRSLAEAQHTYAPMIGQTTLAQDILSSVGSLQAGILATVEKQNGALAPDFYREFVNSVTNMIEMAAFNDSDAARHAFEKLNDMPEDAQYVDYPVLLRLSSYFDFLWTFITKGRMELRASGVHELQVCLVEIWTNSQANDRGSSPVVTYAADFLEKKKVIEYLISVDSHPQLVSRSVNVLNYAMITSRWTQNMTNAVFDTISSSQDSRIVVSILELLQHCLQWANAKVVNAFRKKITVLPSEAFTEAMLQFLVALFENLASKGPTQEAEVMASYQLWVRLMREKSVGSIRSSRESSVAGSVASNIINKLDTKTNNASIRRQVYVDCIQDVARETASSTGSVDAIWALLQNQKNRAQDVNFLCSETNSPQVICDSLFAEVARLKRLGRSDFVEHGFVIRLQMLDELILTGPAPIPSSETESKLWDCLVGASAVSNNYRDEAWILLTSLCRQTRGPNAFIDRCIERHLQQMSPELYTGGLVTFTTEASSYKIRLSSADPLPENSIIELPLGDFFWQIILSASSDDVANEALVLLGRFYSNAQTLSDVNSKTIAATHAGLVERALLYLRDAAITINRDSFGSPGNGPKHGDDELVTQKKLGFVRTIGFLRFFLEQVNMTPRLRVFQKPTKSPSPEFVPAKVVHGEKLMLTYQTFAPGVESEVKQLEVDVATTHSDLHRMLQQITGFPEMRTISGGRPVDLLRYPDLRAFDIAKIGLLIVQDVGTRPLQLRSAGGAAYTTDVESTILSHLDELYNLLDLETSLSRQVYDFIQAFPTHDRIQTLILSADTPFEELFPMTKPYKTMYTLHSLIRLSKHSKGSSGVDEETARMVTSLVTSAFVDPNNVVLNFSRPEDEMLSEAFLDSLLAVLRMSSGSISGDTLRNQEVTLIGRLFSMLRCLKEDTPRLINADRIQCRIYDVFVATVTRNEQCWEAFTSDEACLDSHFWLLVRNDNWRVRDQIRLSIERIVQPNIWTTDEQRNASVMFFWDIVAKLVTRTISYASHAREFFLLASSIVSVIAKSPAVEADIYVDLPKWITVIIDGRTAQRASADVRDEFTFGLTQLVNACIFSRNDQEPPLDFTAIAQGLLDGLLFPAFTDGKLQDGKVAASSRPVLDTDTRKALYNTVLALCRDHTCFREIVHRIKPLVDQAVYHVTLDWDTDRSTLLRSIAGYSGLRNLTNTCYMNSLMAQLFMNTDFRKFILGARVTDGHGSQKLLGATKRLFSHMQSSERKFAETLDFAQAIVPYDAPKIDINVQMDVDEFYNLLFDRWESQMPTKEDKNDFRAIYGGELITQIKSLDCEHVSERTEPYLSISCEVKGKTSLEQSLRTYVQGDAMEGDNKYKCESCGGRFVNAVKRSCLKSIPDNLIFHLKRFDFDLINLQRSKINDHFGFPKDLNMADYKYDTLNDPEAEAQPDWFELVGVLVHLGTAEAGHYYSYIKDGAPSDVRWLEFNDVDVTAFDANKIPEQCFGGFESQWDFIKTNNAYMLFYQRISATTATSSAGVSNLESGLPLPDRSDELSSEIARGNEVMARWYCLLDPSHAHFLRELLLKIRHHNGNACSESHDVEDGLNALVLSYLHRVASHARSMTEFELVLAAFQPQLANCVRCACAAVDWLSATPCATGDFVLRCPFYKVRQQMADAVFVALTTIRNSSIHFECGYGICPEADELQYQDDGLLPRLVQALCGEFAQIGKFARFWGEFFALMSRIARLGRCETAVLLAKDVFYYCAQLVYLADPAVERKRGRSDFFDKNFQHVTRYKKPPSFIEVVQVLGEIFKYLNPWDNRYRTSMERLIACDTRDEPFGITRDEADFITAVDDKQYVFLVKVIDGWETRVNPWVPGEILGAFMDTLDGLDDGNELHMISMSLASGINDYYPDSIDLALKTAVYFFKHCNTVDEAQHLLENAASNATNVKNVGKSMHVDSSDEDTAVTDYFWQGGDAFINFFRAVAELKDTACVNDEEEQPFLQVVIESLLVWTCEMLLSDFQTTRERTIDLLDSLIFGHFPQDVLGEDEPSELDNARCLALISFNHSCHRTFMKYSKQRFLPSFLQQQYVVLEKCNRWAAELKAKVSESEVCTELYRRHEGGWRQVLTSFPNASAMHAQQEQEQLGGNGAGEPLHFPIRQPLQKTDLIKADTEEASDVEDADSNLTDALSRSPSDSPMQ